MGKKKKMRWISNESNGEFNEEALFSDSALDDMIAKSFSKNSVKEAFSETQRQLNIPKDSFMNQMLRESAKNENNAVVGSYYRVSEETKKHDDRIDALSYSVRGPEVTPPQPLQDVLKVMKEMNLSEQDVIDRITAVNEPIETELHTSECTLDSEGVIKTGISVITERDVTIADINGSDYLMISDKFTNGISIPVATEADTTYSLKYMMDKVADDFSTQNKDNVEECISFILNDLAVTMARGQILWGKPDFIIEREEFSDLLSDNQIHSYDGTKLLIATTSNQEYVLGYIIDIGTLVEKWMNVINTYYESKDSYENFDKILITFAALYRVMVDNRYICYNELQESFMDYISMNQNLKDTCEVVMNAFTSYAVPISPELTVEIDGSKLSDLPTIEDLMIESSSETLGLFCDTSDDEEDEEGYDPEDESGEDEANEEESGEEYSDPIAMAEQFANEYAKTHPEVNQNVPHTGYVQNAESAGAPVGGDDFPGETEANSEPVDTEEIKADTNSVVEGSSSNGTVGASDSESNPPVITGVEHGNLSGTEYGHWDANVSNYTKSEKEEEKEIKEEHGSGSSNELEGVQKEVQKKVDPSDDDALIINVNRG